MNEKISQAHACIDGNLVARMVIDFHREFRGVYLEETMTSSLCAVGPLQSMIGLAIKNGLLLPPPSLEAEDAPPL